MTVITAETAEEQLRVSAETHPQAPVIRNIVNRDNPGPIIGNITSSLFGRANQPYGAGSLGGTGFSESANNRRLELQVRFRF